MSIFDSLFGSSAIPDKFTSMDNPSMSIGDVRADFTNIQNIANGKAKSADYGAGIGAIAGAFFGNPQAGANAGRTVFPILSETVKPAFSNLWGQLSK